MLEYSREETEERGPDGPLEPGCAVVSAAIRLSGNDVWGTISSTAQHLKHTHQQEVTTWMKACHVYCTSTHVTQLAMCQLQSVFITNECPPRHQLFPPQDVHISVKTAQIRLDRRSNSHVFKCCTRLLQQIVCFTNNLNTYGLILYGQQPLMVSYHCNTLIKILFLSQYDYVSLWIHGIYCKAKPIRC